MGDIKSSGSALPSLARTATADSTPIFTKNFTGIEVFLDVTAASGTGGLKVRILGVDPISTHTVIAYEATTAVTAIGTSLYVIYPSASAGGTQVWSGVLPEQIKVEVSHGDATSYTYSASYTLLP